MFAKIKKIWQCQKLTKQNKKNEFEFFWSISVKFSVRRVSESG